MRRSLISLATFFFLAGFLLSNWAVRVPDVKLQVGATATALGIALLCQSLGGLISMAIGGRLCVRFGPRPVIVVAGPLTALAVIGPTLATSPQLLAAALLLLGLVYGTFNISLNSAAVDVERVLGKSVMSRLHGLYSCGALAGALVGGAAAAALGPTAHMVTISASGLLTTAVLGSTLLSTAPEPGGARPVTKNGDAASDDPDGSATERRSRMAVARTSGIPTITIVFAVIAFCTAFGEFSAIDWAALHLRQDVGATASAAAIGLACYEGSMTVGRLAGDKVINRFGSTAVLGGGAGLALVGGLLAAWAPGGLPTAYVGYLMFGLGMANVFPIAVARAGALAGPQAVARVAMASTLGIMVERPAVGFLADQIGLPTSLSLIAVLITLIAVLGLAVRDNTATTGESGRGDTAGSPESPADAPESPDGSTRATGTDATDSTETTNAPGH